MNTNETPIVNETNDASQTVQPVDGSSYNPPSGYEEEQGIIANMVDALPGAGARVLGAMMNTDRYRMEREMRGHNISMARKQESEADQRMENLIQEHEKNDKYMRNLDLEWEQRKLTYKDENTRRAFDNADKYAADELNAALRLNTAYGNLKDENQKIVNKSSAAFKYGYTARAMSLFQSVLENVGNTGNMNSELVKEATNAMRMLGFKVRYDGKDFWVDDGDKEIPITDKYIENLKQSYRGELDQEIKRVSAFDPSMGAGTLQGEGMMQIEAKFGGDSAAQKMAEFVVSNPLYTEDQRTQTNIALVFERFFNMPDSEAGAEQAFLKGQVEDYLVSKHCTITPQGKIVDVYGEFGVKNKVYTPYELVEVLKKNPMYSRIETIKNGIDKKKEYEAIEDSQKAAMNILEMEKHTAETRKSIADANMSELKAQQFFAEQQQGNDEQKFLDASEHFGNNDILMNLGEEDRKNLTQAMTMSHYFAGQELGNTKMSLPQIKAEFIKPENYMHLVNAARREMSLINKISDKNARNAIVAPFSKMLEQINAQLTAEWEETRYDDPEWSRKYNELTAKAARLKEQSMKSDYALTENPVAVLGGSYQGVYYDALNALERHMKPTQKDLEKVAKKHADENKKEYESSRKSTRKKVIDMFLPSNVKQETLLYPSSNK